MGMKILDVFAALLHIDSIIQFMGLKPKEFRKLFFSINMTKDVVLDENLFSNLSKYIPFPNIHLELSEKLGFREAESVNKAIQCAPNCNFLLDDLYYNTNATYLLDLFTREQIIGLKYDHEVFWHWLDLATKGQSTPFDRHLFEMSTHREKIIIEGVKDEFSLIFITRSKIAKSFRIFIQGEFAEVDKEFLSILVPIKPFGYILNIPVSREEERKSLYETLCSKGKEYYNISYFKKSIECYEEAEKVAKEMKWGRKGEPSAYIGASYFHIGNYIEANTYLDQALTIAKDREEEIEAFCLLHLGHVYREWVKDFQQAKDFYDKALEISQRIGLKVYEGYCLMNIGNAFKDLLGQSKVARENYHQPALKIAQDISDRRLEGRVWNNIGNTYKAENNLEETKNCYKNATRASYEAGDRHNEAISHGNLSGVIDDVEEKITHLKEAIRLMKESENWMSQMNYLNTLVNIYINLNQTKTITEYLYKNLEESEKGLYPQEDREIWLALLGYTFYQSGELAQAREYYKEAMGVKKAIKDRNMQLQLSPILGELEILEAKELGNSGQLFEALEKCNEAIVNLQTNGFIGMIQLQNQLYNAFHLLRLPSLEAEINNYKQEIKSNPSDSNLHFRLGDCLALKGDLENAISEYQEAIKINSSNLLPLLCEMEVMTWQGLSSPI